jgi:acetyl esterase/lipase
MDRREVLKLGAFAAMAAPLSEVLAAPATGSAAPALTADARFLRLVHPDLRAAASALLHDKSFIQPSAATLGAMRAAIDARSIPPLPAIPVEQRILPGSPGQPEVAVRVVNARPDAARPALLHVHGGGFVAGSTAFGLRELQETCAALDCAAVSVDYRLAPETRWNGALEDVYAALKWLHGHALELGAHPERIAVVGESAGGGLAALLAIAARDRGEVPVAFQCLTYPMLDDRTVSRRFPPQVGRLVWTPQSNRFGWASFLGTAPGGAGVPAAAVPARTPDLAGLPPAFIAVGALDLFFDESADYAKRLNVAGVMAELHAVPGAFHGFDMIAPAAPLSQRFGAARLDALRRGLPLVGVSAPAAAGPYERD